MKRKLSILLVLTLVMSMLAACTGTKSQSSTEPKKLVVAARGGSHVDVLNSVKADFETKNNVKIEILGLEAADLQQKVSLDSKNKKGAYDLAMADDPWMPELTEANIFANLSKLKYKEDSDFVKASL